MNSLEIRAYVLAFAKCVSALAEIEMMKAANADRDRQNLAQAYPESAFDVVRIDIHPDNLIESWRKAGLE